MVGRDAALITQGKMLAVSLVGLRSLYDQLVYSKRSVHRKQGPKYVTELLKGMLVDGAKE